jgi:hypothetical protein
MKFPVTGIKEPARENKKRFKHCISLITQQNITRETKGTSTECSYLDTRVKFQMILGYKYRIIFPTDSFESFDHEFP